MSSSSWSPNEAAHIINDEVTWLQGAFLSSLLCGVQITLSTMAFFAVLKQRLRRRLRIALLVYVFFLCAIMTAGQQTSLLFIQMGFIESRNYQGGPNAFLSARYTEPVDLAATTLFVIANWMTESLLVWRCKVVCCTGDHPLWIGAVIPPLVLVGEYVAGSLFLHHLLLHRHAVKYALVYTGLSLLLNVTVTAIIAGRLLLHRRRMVRQFGPGHGSHYASVAAVLVESASLYTGFLILVIIFFCVGTPTSNVLQQAVAQVESIASLLIIYRIASGKGWSDDAAVSSGEWRGDAEIGVEPGAVHLEMAADPTRASGVHATSVLSKEDETSTPMSTSSVNASLPLDGAV